MAECFVSGCGAKKEIFARGTAYLTNGSGTVIISSFGFANPPIVVATSQNQSPERVNVTDITSSQFTIRKEYGAYASTINWIAIGE